MMEEETALGFEFFLVVVPNSLKKMRLPDKFAKVLDDLEPRELKLREAGRRRLLWVIDVVFDSNGHMYLGHGWEQFARAHDLRLGHFLILCYDGHSVLTVKVFDGSMCRRDYQHDGGTSSGSSSDSGNTLQGAEVEEEAPSQTGAEEDYGKQGVSKISNPCDSDGSQNERSYSSEELSAEDSLFVDNSMESANSETLSNNYVLSAQCYLTNAQKVKIDAFIEKIQPIFTVLVVQMKKSNIKRHALVIQKDYALKHFPCENRTVILQLPGKNKGWKCPFRIRPSGASDAGRRNLFLRNFTCDNHVREGDICLFQPMTNVKQRRFVLTIHIIHKKATIDHSLYGRTDIGSNGGSTSTKIGSVKEEPPTDGEEYSSEHEEHEVSEDSEEASERLFMLSSGASLTPAQEMKCLEKVEEIKFKPPFYVAIMSKSTVCQRGSQRSPSLHFGSQYAATYLVQKFAAGLHHGENSPITLVLQREGKSRSWPTKLQYKYRKRDTGNQMTVLNGWLSFARDNRLREGDICLFKLMDNEEQLRMMVYIVRR